MDFDDPSMVWEPRWIGRPVDTHFSANNSSPLARSDLTNLLETHGVLGPRIEKDDDAEEGSDLLKWAVVLAAGVLLGVGAIKVAPRIISWRKDRRAPTRSPSDTGRADDEAVAPGAAVVSSPAMDSAAFASGVDIALEDHRRSMSSAEAQRRLLAILMAGAFIADQMRALSNARVDDGPSAELQETMDKLSTPQLTDSLNRMLEADASVLDDATAAALLEVFGGGQVVEGQFVPLSNEKIKRALRLPEPKQALPDSEL